MSWASICVWKDHHSTHSSNNQLIEKKRKKKAECYNRASTQRVYSMCGLYHLHLWSQWVADCAGVLKALHSHTNRGNFRSLQPWESKQHCSHQVLAGCLESPHIWCGWTICNFVIVLHYASIIHNGNLTYEIGKQRYWWILRVAFQKYTCTLFYVCILKWQKLIQTKGLSSILEHK